MVEIKNEVAGWQLYEENPNWYTYQKIINNFRYTAGMIAYDGKWALEAGGGPDNERFGSVGTRHTMSKVYARNLLHCFLKRFDGGGYNGLVETADSCGWPE